jgi:hypothetical protein
VFGEAAASGDSSAAGTGEIVAIGTGNAFDDAEVAQAGELPGEGGGRAWGEQWHEVGAAKASDVEAGTVQGREQGLFSAAEKVEPLDGAAVDRTGLGEAVEGPDTGREVV